MPLDTLLQFLVTDASCVSHLPYILNHLSPSSLAPSPHLQKWTARVTSLMHSKDPAARWAAICIAHRMSFLSTSLLVDNAQSWVGIVFPSLSRPEPTPIITASMRYLSLVLCSAGHNTEFQKQVAIPVVPKVSSALLAIAEGHNNSNLDVKTSSIRALVQLVPLYPSLHKALSQRLFALCSKTFNDNTHRATDAIVNLYAVLHCIGGKVGGITLWRNYLDEILQFSWSAWLNLRTSFPASARLSSKAVGSLRSSNGKLPSALSHTDTTVCNPLATVAFNLDKLRRGVRAISALLRAPISRPVKVPIGHLAAFCWCLLSSTPDDDDGETHFDPHRRAAESTVVPQIWIEACYLLTCLAETTRDSLAPHISRLIMIISTHLENNPEWPQKHVFLRCAHQLLYFCPVVGVALGINRLLKVTISTLSPLYLHRPHKEMNTGTASQSRASKKRRREYEADSVLSACNITICPTQDECDTLITALDVMEQCMLNVELTSSTRSLANRVLLSILMSLPSIPSLSLSFDPNVHGRVVKKVREICIESVQGNSYAMNKGTSFVLQSYSSENLVSRDKFHSRVDLLLHPRRPPFVRTLPFTESLSLSRAEESPEETAIRHSLELVFGDGEIRATTELQNHTKEASQNMVDLKKQPHPPQIQTLLSSTESYIQTAGDPNPDVAFSMVTETSPIPSTKSPLRSVSDAPAGLALPVPQKEHVLMAHETPMLVDESDHEEVPSIDLGSDSDA